MSANVYYFASKRKDFFKELLQEIWFANKKSLNVC